VLFHDFDRFLIVCEARFEREYGYFRPVVREVVDRYLDCGNPRAGLALMIRCRLMRTAKRCRRRQDHRHGTLFVVMGRLDRESAVRDFTSIFGTFRSTSPTRSPIYRKG